MGLLKKVSSNYPYLAQVVSRLSQVVTLFTRYSLQRAYYKSLTSLGPLYTINLRVVLLLSRQSLIPASSWVNYKMKLSLPRNQKKKKNTRNSTRKIYYRRIPQGICDLFAETSSYRLYGWVVTTKPTDQKKSLQVSFRRKIHDFFFLISQRIENTANFQLLPR